MYTQVICESLLKQETFNDLVYKKLPILEKNRVLELKYCYFLPYLQTFPKQYLTKFSALYEFIKNKFGKREISIW
jgi:hypothetical protein